jgi:uncharacterized protein DUF4395
MSRTPARVVLSRADPPADPRGARFAAGLTAVVALAVLITSSEALFAAQAVVFALGALLGARYAPYQALYRVLGGAAPGSAVLRAGVAARGRAPEPYRFAQAIGLLLAVTGTLGYLTGLAPLGAAAAALVLIGAALNAATGLSIGAELYEMITRFAHRPST